MSITRLASAVLLILSLVFLTSNSSAITKPDKHKGRAPNRSLKQAEVKDAEARLSEMGYGTGRVDGVIDAATRNALIAFQKYEGRKVTGRMSREDFDAIVAIAILCAVLRIIVACFSSRLLLERLQFTERKDHHAQQ